MVRIESMKIKGLYSFKDETLIRFDTNNLIIGPNNSGKTNIFRILKLIIPTMINPYDISNIIRHNKSAELPSVEFNIHFSEEEAKDLAIFMVFSLLGNSGHHADELEFFRKEFSKFQDYVIKLEYPDTGSEKSDEIEIFCKEKKTGMVMVQSQHQSPIISSSKTWSREAHHSISGTNSIVHHLVSNNYVLDSFGPKELLEIINDDKQDFQFRSVERPNSNFPKDRRTLNNFKTRWELKVDQGFTFFQIIGKMI